MTAAPIHFERLPWERATRLLRAMGRVLLDSEKTNEIIVAEEIAAQAQLRYWVENGVFERGEGPDLLRDRPEIAHLDLDALRALPGGSLGREFAGFLDQHGIEADILGHRSQAGELCDVEGRVGLAQTRVELAEGKQRFDPHRRRL